MKTVLTLILLMSVILGVSLIDTLPWWSFSVPVFLIGFILPLKKWNVQAFLSGFFAGFILWIVATVYFEYAYTGAVVSTISELMNLSSFALYFIVGLIGGVLAGLAMYSGYLLRKGQEILNLGLPKV